LGSNAVLGVCDKELCGKTLNGKKTEFVVSNSFYNGEPVSIEELRIKLHEFENINIVGNKAVQIALEEGLVSKDNVIEIAKVKHVQIFKI